MTERKSRVGLGVVAVAVVGLCCVCCVAMGATLGVPAYAEYLQRAKTAEASSNLRNLFQLSAAYYASESFGGGAVATACTVDPATTSNVPSAQKSVLDSAREPESFRALGFSVADPIYYQYEIAGAPGRCDHPASSPVYSLRAHGDLDDDGTRSLFELSVGSTATNELERSPGIYTERELE